MAIRQTSHHFTPLPQTSASPLTFQIKPKFPDSSAEQALIRHQLCARSCPDCQTQPAGMKQNLDSTATLPLVLPPTPLQGSTLEAANGRYILFGFPSVGPMFQSQEISHKNLGCWHLLKTWKTWQHLAGSPSSNCLERSPSSPRAIKHFPVGHGPHHSILPYT